MNRQGSAKPTLYLVVILAALSIGVFLRFSHLGRKVYWYDEAVTSLWMSGHRLGEALAQLTTDAPVEITKVQRFQHLDPGRGLFWSLLALAADDPKHPPIYYGTLRLWMHVAGDSAAGIRSLPAVISLLVFPLAWQLSLELFGSRPAAWLTVGLIAISPFHVLYAQEARQHSLWAVAVLFASLALLRALRLQTRSAWRIYAFAVAFALYTHTLSALVLPAHALYTVFSTRRFPEEDGLRFPKAIGEYLRATAWGILGFVPWLAIIVIRLPVLRANTAWLTEDAGLGVLAQHWLRGLGSVFLSAIEPVTQADVGLFLTAGELAAYLAVVILVIGSYLYVRRWADRQAWWFLLLLAVVPAMALIFPDLVLGGKRSLPARFFVPCYLSAQLSVGYFLARGSSSTSFAKRSVFSLITAVVLFVGAFSCWLDFGKETTWNKGSGRYHPELARTINRTAHPLLISEADGGELPYLLALSHSLESKVRVQLFRNSIPPIVFDRYSEVFVYRPPLLMRRVLENEIHYRMELVYEAGQLWRLKGAELGL